MFCYFFRLSKKCLYSFLSYLLSCIRSCERPYGVRGLGRTVELASSLFWRNFVYLSLLPFLLFPLLFFLWYRSLGYVSSPKLFSTGILGSIPNIEISTCMGWKLGKDSALSLLKTLFPLFLLILCPKPIPASLLSKGGSSVYGIFDIKMKKLTKIKVFHSDSGGEYISAAFQTLLALTHFIYKALSQRSCPQL